MRLAWWIGAVGACVVALVARGWEACDGEVQVVVKDGVSFLLRHGAVIGASFVDAPEAAAFRGWALQRSSARLVPEARSALVIGVGAGSVVNDLRRRGLEVDAVDVDADVVRLAETHFGVSRGSVSVADGLRVLETTPKRYDLVLIDVVDPARPLSDVLWRFLSVDALGTAKRVGRTLVFNVVSPHDVPNLVLVTCVASRLGSTFRHVRGFRDSPFEDDEATNVVFFASDDAPVDVERLRSDVPAEPGTEDWVVATFAEWEYVSCDAGTCALSLPGAEPWRADDETAKTPPGAAYEAALAKSLRDLTESYLPTDLRGPAPPPLCRARRVLRAFFRS